MTSSPRELLLRARQLIGITHPEEILAATCREILATGASGVVAAVGQPAERWESWTHLHVDESGSRRTAPAARSALFSIHRSLSMTRQPVELRRSPETAAVFAGLGCPFELELIHAIPLVHRTGRLWGAFAILSDRVDLEVVAELALVATVALENAQRLAFARRDQDRLLLLAEATHDVFYDWNFDTREFWWGGGIVKLFGSSIDPIETSVRWKLERVHEDDRELVRRSLEEARFSTEVGWHCEYRFARADRSYVHVEDHGYFLREANGRAYRMIGSMHDVTAIKQALAREQEARAESERANRAKDEFLAMLGHELRNPLAPIVTGLKLIRMRGSGELEKEITILERQANHLVRLVDDLLDISRIAHGKIALHLERLDIAAIVEAALETASPLVEGRRHQVSLDVPAGLFVDGDRARLAQAISNLVTNAAKYTEPGGQIAVRAWRDGASIAISIRDTGVGIDAAMLATIFDMFVQERQSIDRAQGGLGLGLSIVRSLVELHGGTVRLHSDGRGKGSEFTIRLPAAAPAVRAKAPVLTPKRDRRATGRRILVVDDNEDAADLLSMLLERMGNITRVVNDPHLALDVVDEFAPDLAVLDIGLPVMDGYELARRLRGRESTKGTRLIALTGYGQADDKARATDAGFDEHLVKPIALDALEAAIVRLSASRD